MSELQVIDKNALQTADTQLTMQNRLEIIKEGIRKNYLSRLTDLEIATFEEKISLEEELIDNIRLYHISEMVYKKGDFAADKFTTVFNTLSTYNATVFIVMESDGKKSRFRVSIDRSCFVCFFCNRINSHQMPLNGKNIG